MAGPGQRSDRFSHKRDKSTKGFGDRWPRPGIFCYEHLAHRITVPPAGQDNYAWAMMQDRLHRCVLELRTFLDLLIVFVIGKLRTGQWSAASLRHHPCGKI